jgi:hypothetical protein
MEEYYITGTIYDADPETMDRLVRAVLGELKSGPSMVGYDILFEREHVRIFLNTPLHPAMDWSLNGDFKGSYEEVHALVSKFVKAIFDADFNYSFGLVQMGENANESERNSPGPSKSAGRKSYRCALV